MYNYVYICIIMADLHSCMAETITTLKNNFPPIKKLTNIKWNGSIIQD